MTVTPQFDVHDTAPPARSLCTDCGVSRMDNPKLCGVACQFIKPDYLGLETTVHGRVADTTKGDERFFGVNLAMHRAALKSPRQGAQWTGLTTRIAERLLETGDVEAVVAVRPHPDDKWRPDPVIIERGEDMAKCRGMRMGYAPVLAKVEEAAKRGIKRLGVVAIPCQVHALRALERHFGFEHLRVIGTPCSDNTTTENFHTFLGLLDEQPERITYLEFRADYQVELRFTNGEKRLIPFLKLPISKLPSDFFPLTCRTCVDYTNRLADITVGYMAGEGDQWLIVRNGSGAEMVAMLGDEVALSAPGSKGNRVSSVKGFIANTERAAGGLPLRAMPDWLRPIMGWLMPKIGPRGLEFARTRVEMKAAETLLHLQANEPARMKHMVPDHVRALMKPYGLADRIGSD